MLTTFIHVFRILALSASLLLFLAASGQGDDEKRLVLLETMKAPILEQFCSSFLDRLAALQDTDGPVIAIERLNADGSPERARTLIAEALATKTDIVVSVATSAARAVQADPDGQLTPHIFMAVTDPVGAGLVEQVGVPSQSNITGKIHYVNAATRIEMVDRLLRQKHGETTIRFGYVHTDYPADLSDLNRLMSAARDRPDIEFVPYRIGYRDLSTFSAELLEELRTAIVHLNDQVDYFWAPRGALSVVPEHDDVMLETADKPFLVGATEQSVQKGALLHITADPESQGQDVALMAVEILNGRDPGDIPVTLPQKILFAVNLTTALDLEIAIPSDFLTLAHGRIFR